MYIVRMAEERKAYQIKLSDEEAARIRKQAGRQHLTFSTYIRSQLMQICDEEEAQENEH